VLLSVHRSETRESQCAMTIDRMTTAATCGRMPKIRKIPPPIRSQLIRPFRPT
jgi:hypothetical protein